MTVENDVLALKSKELDCLVLVGDCLEWLPQLPPASADLTVCDPPYESLERQRALGTTTRLKESKSSSNPWFATFPNKGYYKLFLELYRIIQKNAHCYIFCDSETEHVILNGRNPYNDKLDTELLQHQFDITMRPTASGIRDGLVRPIDCGVWTVWPTLTWVKTKKGLETSDPDELEPDMVVAGMGYHWRRSGERILFLEKGKRRLNNLGWPDTLLGPKAGRSDFPTQKPVSVLEKLILNSAEPGEIVLDCFAGSGSTAMAAMKHGRRAILVEKYPTDKLRENLARCTRTDGAPLPARIHWEEKVA